jgi:hypothetical protein
MLAGMLNSKDTLQVRSQQTMSSHVTILVTTIYPGLVFKDDNEQIFERGDCEPGFREL